MSIINRLVIFWSNAFANSGNAYIISNLDKLVGLFSIVTLILFSVCLIIIFLSGLNIIRKAFQRR